MEGYEEHPRCSTVCEGSSLPALICRRTSSGALTTLMRRDNETGSRGSPFSRQTLDTLDDGPSTPKADERSRTCEPLLFFTLVGVVTGLGLGALLRPAQLGATVIDFIGFPGEIMLRLLKMVILPLVSLSMISGVCSLRNSGSGHTMARLAQLSATFYAACTLVAIAVGILLVQTIQPGRRRAVQLVASASSIGCQRSDSAAEATAAASGQPQTGTSQALLHVVRMMAPDNLVAAAVEMNVLGVITFSLLFGWALSSLGPRADALVEGVHALNAAIGKMVTCVLWTSPLGVGSLIAASVLRACDLGGTAAALGLWMLTVVLGLLLFGGIILPMALLLLTGQSPIQVAAGFGQALAMAVGTSSSAAALPLAMSAAEDMGCSEGVVSFFLPLGIAINLSGTALYEAVTAIWIAQSHGIPLGFGGVVVVAATASLAAVGAPAIPSAGLVTMMVVLQAAGLGAYTSDIASVLAVDWLLDRLRTGVNCLGDVYGVMIVDSLIKRRKSDPSYVEMRTRDVEEIQQDRA